MENQLLKRWDHLHSVVRKINPVLSSGRVTSMVGLVAEVEGVSASVGDLCRIETGRNTESIVAEVVGFRDERLLVMPLERTIGVGEGSPVFPLGKRLDVPVGEQLLGRVIGALGEPLDGNPQIVAGEWRPLDGLAPSPMTRRPIKSILETGIKVVDSTVPTGIGQRMGIFAGSGVGKSVLLGMICRYARSDVNVIALIGERGREVREFVDNILGRKGLEKSVVVVATSDRSPVMRVKGAETAMTIAEYFRDMGKNVLFIMDSVTRYAMAQREIGLAIGEPPTSRGYTPSVFAKLPALLERAGSSANGSITGFYSVLVEGDDVSADPLTDAVRAILDGHIILSRRIANTGQYPAVDVLESVSRLASALLNERQQQVREKVLRWFANYREAEDLINIGAYERGSNPTIDEAIEMTQKLREFFRQPIEQSFSFAETEKALMNIVGGF
ncbi:MAG: hypothetical protein B6D63_03530 [Candidatus Latescibacteria bacterium 4484_7]|nr:MAG: hypothetical protein B6D63_03530 [Candidatus Latescibacteria bacterium 4484_7]